VRHGAVAGQLAGHTMWQNICPGTEQLVTRVAEYGDIDNPQVAERIVAWRKKMAALLNATPEEMAVIGNTVQGVNLVANGIRWCAGDNMVVE
jgi:selenocysteine lyase/cysteine desulfurase